MKSLDEQDPTFRADLEDSSRWVQKVASWLHDSGNRVVLNPVRFRPSSDRLEEYSDDGDLGIIHRLEVKHRNLSFTGAEDFPYPTIIVDAARLWDEAKPKPYGYILLNQKGTHAAVALGRDWKKWKKTKRKDSMRTPPREREYYEAPVHTLRFVEVGQPLWL
jgi:hypothetical protein